MSSPKQADRLILCGFVLMFALIAVYGMRVNNSDITKFATSQFTLFAGALLILLNKELLGNGNGNGNSNGTSEVIDPPEKKD